MCVYICLCGCAIPVALVAADIHVFQVISTHMLFDKFLHMVLHTYTYAYPHTHQTYARVCACIYCDASALNKRPNNIICCGVESVSEHLSQIILFLLFAFVVVCFRFFSKILSVQNIMAMFLLITVSV